MVDHLVPPGETVLVTSMALSGILTVEKSMSVSVMDDVGVSLKVGFT